MAGLKVQHRIVCFIYNFVFIVITWWLANTNIWCHPLLLNYIILSNLLYQVLPYLFYVFSFNINTMQFCLMCFRNGDSNCCVHCGFCHCGQQLYEGVAISRIRKIFPKRWKVTKKRKQKYKERMNEWKWYLYILENKVWICLLVIVFIYNRICQIKFNLLFYFTSLHRCVILFSFPVVCIYSVGVLCYVKIRSSESTPRTSWWEMWLYCRYEQ